MWKTDCARTGTVRPRWRMDMMVYIMLYPGMHAFFCPTHPPLLENQDLPPAHEPRSRGWRPGHTSASRLRRLPDPPLHRVLSLHVVHIIDKYNIILFPTRLGSFPEHRL